MTIIHTNRFDSDRERRAKMHPDPYAPTPAELRAGRYADALIDERIGK